MRHQLISGILTLAVCSILRGQDAAAPAATQPARAQKDVPITEVALFNSGVGFFKHAGPVEGNAFTELHFKTDQINDILKSLVLQDSGGGHIGTVTYPSQDPVERTLHRYQVDISSDPPLEGLLQQPRARVQLHKGDEKIAGQIIGLQQKERPLQEGDKIKVIHPWFINILSGADVHSVALDDVSKIELLEPELQRDFQAALTTLAKARDQDKKTVTVNFDGAGPRNVAFGYLTETPIWKTSYRLIMPQTDAAGNLKDPAAKSVLQGWALVENQTDADWTGVKLTLISGHPISFIQNLYESLYNPRPTYVPEFIGSLNPQTYEGGAALGAQNAAPPQYNLQDMVRGGSGGSGALGGGGGGLFNSTTTGGEKSEPSGPRIIHRGGSQVAAGGINGQAVVSNGEFNPAEGVATIADPSKIGELFQYSIDHVTLPRGKSAMIPVVTDPVEIQRVSIYNATVLPKNPLYGARLKNTTGKHLLQGPISVIQSGDYAGDAQIADVPPGESRLLSYGIDQDVVIDTKNDGFTKLQRATIIKGQLILIYKTLSAVDYTARSSSDSAKTLIIEHAHEADDKLLEPAAAAETTDALYRLELAVPAHKSATLRATLAHVRQENVDLALLKMEDLQLRINNGELPQKIRAALTEIMNRVLALEQKHLLVDQKAAERAGIAQDQTRIRDNIKVADHADKVYQRLETKLNDQETQLETLDKEIVDQTAIIVKQQKELKDYMQTLAVE